MPSSIVYSQRALRAMALAFTGLAYGARAMEYFAFTTELFGGWGDGIITPGGEASARYDICRRVSHDIALLGPTLAGFPHRAHVGGSGSLPCGAAPAGRGGANVPPPRPTSGRWTDQRASPQAYRTAPSVSS